MQPDASASAAASDPVRLPCLVCFSFHLRARNPSFPRSKSLGARQIEALKPPASPKSPPPQTLEQLSAPHQGDGSAVQKDASADTSGRPAVAASIRSAVDAASRPAVGAAPRPAAVGATPRPATTPARTRCLDPPTATKGSGGLCTMLAAPDARPFVVHEC